MKNLIKRHHVATWERGRITPKTNIDDFIDKLNEEFYEFQHEYFTETELTKEMIHEAVDICAVIINMLKHYNIDFVEEYRKNVEYQESRVI